MESKGVTKVKGLSKPSAEEALGGLCRPPWGSLSGTMAGTIAGTMLNYKKDPMSCLD